MDEEVKKLNARKKILEQNTKLKLMMIIDVITEGETNEFFFGRRVDKGGCRKRKRGK